jgi:hypothetical protein
MSRTTHKANKQISSRPALHGNNQTRQQQAARQDGVVDMELTCLTCGTELYVPEAELNRVMLALLGRGELILICNTCQQAQLITWKWPRRAGLQA